MTVAREGSLCVLGKLLTPFTNQVWVDLMLAGNGINSLAGIYLCEDVELQLSGELSSVQGHGFSLLCLVELNPLSQFMGPVHVYM